MIICVMVCLLSCKQSFEEIPSSIEVVNGFRVEWRKNVDDEKKIIIRNILYNMQYVEGGIFLMGATQNQVQFARGNEYPARYVELSDYYIAKNEMSISDLEILLSVEFNSYERKNGAPEYSWNDWRRFIEIIRDYTNINFDFPTEAQWEYAAKGGINSLGYIYPGSNILEESESVENELSLYDMAKGHSEWCKDAYNEYPNFPLEVDPYCIQGIGHVVRGGNAKSITEQKDYLNTYSTGDKFHNCYDDVRNCRVSARSYCDETQSYLNNYITCRLVINNIK